MGTKKGTSLDSPITKVTIPLIGVSKDGGEMYPGGTGIVIAPFLALTAAHVVEGIFRHFEGRDLGPNNERTFKVLTYVKPSLGEFATLHVAKMWTSGAADLAVLYLLPDEKSSIGPDHVWDSVPLDVLPPVVGDPVVAFGYPNTTWKLDESSTPHDVRAEVLFDATTTEGRVLEVHPNGRDKVMLPFPCFRADTWFGPAMSGGPVFNNKSGHVCGLVCTGLDLGPAAPEGDHDSNAALIWPALAIRIDAPWTDKYPEGTSYPLYEYATAGIINVANLDRLRLEPNGTLWMPP